MFDNLELVDMYLAWQTDLLHRISLVDQEARASNDARGRYVASLATSAFLGSIYLRMVFGWIGTGYRRRRGWNCGPRLWQIILGSFTGFAVSFPLAERDQLWPEVWIPGGLCLVVFLVLSACLRIRDKIRWNEHLEWKRQQPVGYSNAHEFPDRSNNYGRDLK